MELITPIEKEKRKERNSQSKEFYEELQGKFQGCLAISTLKKNFSLGELSRLNEIDIDLEEINESSKHEDKIVRLKAKLIPIDEILKIAKEIITKDSFCTLEDIDKELQKKYIVNARTEMVYLKDLKNIFQNKLFDNIEYLKRKKIGKKFYRHLLLFTTNRV